MRCICYGSSILGHLNNYKFTMNALLLRFLSPLHGWKNIECETSESVLDAMLLSRIDIACHHGRRLVYHVAMKPNKERIFYDV